MPTKQTQKSSSESAPWKPAQGGLQDILAKAQTLGGNNNLFTPVQGATTQQALNQTKQIANQGSAALDPLQSVVGGSVNGFGTGIDQLIATARGDNLGTVAPQFQQALDRASQGTANTVNQQFAASGRYGSANHAGTIADRVGALQTNALVDNFNAERANQMAASGQLQQGGYQGAGLAPAIDQARLFTPQLLGQVGATQDAFAMAKKQAPLDAAQFQAGLTMPIAGLGGTQNGTTTSKTSNPLGTIVGGLMTGAGMMSGGVGSSLASGFGNLARGAPWSYGNSWSPWTQPAG
jgi:hypothetical protein